MADERFEIGYNERKVVVIDMPLEKFNGLGRDDKRPHVLAEFNIQGAMSKHLAHVYAEQIMKQLNQFDVANAAVAKLTG